MQICTPFLSAAVPVGILVLVIVLIVVLILVLIVILVVVLVVLILIAVHDFSSVNSFCGTAAILAYPKNQLLSLALKMRLARSPATIATVIPPADASRPPLKMPIKPSLSTASLTPFARL